MAAGRTQEQASIDGIPAVEPRWDCRFRELTGLGNAAFRAGDEARAERFYREALEEADVLIDFAARGEGAILVAPMALTVAAHNLSAARERAGESDDARAISVEVVNRLIATAESAERPIALRLNCIRHLRHALGFLVELDRSQNRSGASTARLAKRVARVAAEVIRVAGLWRGLPDGSGCVRA